METTEADRVGQARLDEIVTVSRETRERLALYVELVRKWQKSQNLVAPSTLAHLWERHVADSAQVVALLPHARRWIDIGSGAGFPGLVTAILSAEREGAVVHLVESNRGKAAFLRTVARETGAPAIVHARRIEDFSRDFEEPVDAVSARALAPLVELCGFAAPHVARGAVAVFHKGQDFASEVHEATLSWDLDLLEHPSRVERSGRLIEIRQIVSRSPA
ncbi:MAG: 16S rRNA (guanine(527)-N(7))-methyltransferase RsmG [Siculibacillus sp.]